MRNTCLEFSVDDDKDIEILDNFQRRGSQEIAQVKLVKEIVKSNNEKTIAVYSPRIPVAELLSVDKLLIRRSWRSLPLHWVFIVLLSVIAIKLSDRFPASIIDLSFGIPSFIVQISFPLFVIPLFLVLFHAFEKIYDRHIILDPEYLVYYRGNHSMSREVCDMETASMQVVTVKQKSWEAILGVGNVSLGRFSRRGMEFDLYGVANPYRLARLLKISVLRARKNAGKLSDRLKNEEEDGDCLDSGKHY